MFARPQAALKASTVEYPSDGYFGEAFRDPQTGDIDYPAYELWGVQQLYNAWFNKSPYSRYLDPTKFGIEPEGLPTCMTPPNPPIQSYFYSAADFPTVYSYYWTIGIDSTNYAAAYAALDSAIEQLHTFFRDADDTDGGDNGPSTHFVGYQRYGKWSYGEAPTCEGAIQAANNGFGSGVYLLGGNGSLRAGVADLTVLSPVILRTTKPHSAMRLAS